MKPRTLYVCGGTLLLLGVILGAGGPMFFALGFHSILKKGVEDYIVVSSNSSDTYTDWLTDQDMDVPFMVNFIMWNLTNPHDVLNGKLPQYQKVGPYVYRRSKVKTNPIFLKDGDEVQFSPQRSYLFLANSSAPNALDTDVIVNINPAYVGAAMLADEAGLQFGAGASFINQIIQTLNSQFVDLYMSYTVPSRLSSVVSATIQVLKPLLSNSTDQAYAYFYAAWANATTQPDLTANWAGLQVSRASIPTNLSIATVKQLFDPLQPWSLTNTTESATTTWLMAYLNNTASQTTLMNWFQITQTQLNLILTWRNTSFVPLRVVGYLLDTYDLRDIRDLGFLQWGTGTPLNGQSVTTVFPSMSSSFIASPPEYILFPGNPPLDVETCKHMLYGTYGLTTVAGVQAFFTNPPPDPSLWGLDENTATAVAGWFYAFLIPSYVNVSFTEIFNSESGGLVVKKTVDEWLFHCTDPIVALVQPDKNNCDVFTNNSIDLPTVMKTGAGSLDDIGQYVQWFGSSEVLVWAQPVPVTGSTEDGQFQPFLSESTPLSVWEDQLLMNVPLVKVDEEDIEGITTWKYGLTSKTLIDKDPLYYQNITGFANLTSVKQTTIFLSNFDFYAADPYYQKRVNVTLNLNATRDQTFLNVEPITGLVFRAEKRLQVNVYLPPGVQGTWFATYFPTVATDVMYPLFSIEEYTVITEDLADKWKNKIGLALKLKVILFWVTLALGIALFVSGAVVIGATWRKARVQSMYAPIQG